MNSVINNGLAGIQKGFQDLNKAADKIASNAKIDVTKPSESAEPGQHSDTLIDAMVEMKESEHLVKASAKVVETGKEMEQNIIDILV